jgi:glycosyltransferase involved in cell wall biosynthesis
MFNVMDNYNWIVQTELIKDKLSKKIVNNKNRIRVLPFYFDKFKDLKIEKSPNSFLYVSGFLPHKNHDRLIKAFVIAAENHKENIFLNLTLKSEDFIHLMKPFLKIPSNLIIENLGVLDLEEINLAYVKNQNLIFPSLKESFGLPLIEATLKKLNVITSNLDFVKYVIEPSLIFNPLDIEDISNSILKTLTLNKLKNPRLVSKNKVDELINILSSV